MLWIRRWHNHRLFLPLIVYFRYIFERANTMVMFSMNARYVPIETNKVGIDIPGHDLVWTLLLDGM